jgi:hypothetical protein
MDRLINTQDEPRAFMIKMITQGLRHFSGGAFNHAFSRRALN